MNLPCHFSQAFTVTAGSAPGGEEMLSLFWHFTQSGMSIHSIKLWPALGGREEDGALFRLAQGLRGSTSSNTLAGIKSVVALFSFISSRINQGSKSVLVIPERKKSHLGFFVCGFGLGFFWSKVLFSARETCFTQGGAGGRKGTATFPSPYWPGFTVKGGQLGWKGSRTLTNYRFQRAVFINYSKTKAKAYYVYRESLIFNLLLFNYFSRSHSARQSRNTDTSPNTKT